MLAFIFNKSLPNITKNFDYLKFLKIKYSTNSEPVTSHFYFHSEYSDELNHEFRKNFSIHDDFITEKHEDTLMNEIAPRMRRMRYEYDHWDNAIHGFKEIQKESWTDNNLKVIENIRKCAFSPGKDYLPLVHILDLAANGYIKPHVDSVRFCGDTIAGLSLLSDSIMRLVSEKHNMTVDILLNRRSLYIMRGFTRYDFTHEILPTDQSIFMGKHIEKDRRISLICRSTPPPPESGEHQ